MTWARLEDSFPEHPKIAALSDGAFRLHVTAICYASKFNTDGDLSAAAFRVIRGSTKLAGELLGAGVWEKNEDGAWRIHDFLHYNPSREEQAGRRQTRADAGRLGGLKSGEARRSNGEANASPKTKQMLEAKTNPVPSRPVPSASHEAVGGGEPIDIGFRDRYGTLVTAFGGRIEERIADEFRQMATDYNLSQINEAIAMARRSKAGQLYPSRIARFLPDLVPVVKREPESRLRDAWELFPPLPGEEMPDDGGFDD